MSEQRILFAKYGTAKYISHLDLMHTMERAFLRQVLPFGIRQGFIPILMCPSRSRFPWDSPANVKLWSSGWSPAARWKHCLHR